MTPVVHPEGVAPVGLSSKLIVSAIASPFMKAQATKTAPSLSRFMVKSAMNVRKEHEPDGRRAENDHRLG